MKTPVVFITGGRGFVGRATVLAFRAVGYATYTIGHPRSGDDPQFHLPWTFDSIGELAGQMRVLQPSAIIHLAAAEPGATPDMHRQITVQSTDSLLKVMEQETPKATFIYLGSAAEYGESLFLDRPLCETDPCFPITPYGHAKHAASLLVLAARHRGLRTTVARLFTAIGPGMPRQSILGRITFEIAQMSKEGNILHVGNLETYRDFLDVRDVAQYLLKLAGSETGFPPVIHLCSGEAQKTREWVEALVAHSGKKIVLQTDPTFLRAHDPEKVVGSTDLMKLFGLIPRLPEMQKLMGEII